MTTFEDAMYLLGFDLQSPEDQIIADLVASQEQAFEDAMYLLGFDSGSDATVKEGNCASCNRPHPTVNRVLRMNTVTKTYSVVRLCKACRGYLPRVVMVELP